MKTKSLICILLSSCLYSAAIAQEDTLIKRPSNLFMASLQPTLFRLNYFAAEFFNNPSFKPGFELCFHYGRVIKNAWVIKSGIDITTNQGKFILGLREERKYVNESFARIPILFVKRFPIDCNDCFMSPSVFIEAGWYASFSIFQATYVQDAPTGLSTLDNRQNFSYIKSGWTFGLGLSYLSNNFGRHVMGVRFYADQMDKEFQTTAFKPSYNGVAVFYNIANISW